MIIFKKWGWLGNQIFQYCAARSIMKPSEVLVLSGFEQLEELFEGIDAVFVNKNSSRLKNAFFKRLFLLIEKLAEKGYITFITEYKNQVLGIESGSLGFIKFVYGAFFQYETILNSSIVETLKIKKIHLDKADAIIAGLNAEDKELIFVHVRRGDYLKWPNIDKPAVLPLVYYKFCMDSVRREVDNPLFIIASDDKHYITKHFSSEDSVFISKHEYTTDFALMTKCSSGILSASSFSWWAAYFVNKKNRNAKLLAPKYWVGHRNKSWYPAHIETSFLEYINVDRL